MFKDHVIEPPIQRRQRAPNGSLPGPSGRRVPTSVTDTDPDALFPVIRWAFCWEQDVVTVAGHHPRLARGHFQPASLRWSLDPG